MPTLSRRIVVDFKRGLSTVGLARKYGRTKLEIEAIIRRRLRRQHKERRLYR